MTTPARSRKRGHNLQSQSLGGPSIRGNDWLGVGMFLLASFLFAFNGVLSKQAISVNLPPQQWTALRSIGAALVLGIAIAVSRPKSLKIKRKEIPFLAAYGLIAFALVQWLYFVTITNMPVGAGTLLVYLAPVVTALYLRIFRNVRVGARLWIAIALAIGGLALVSGFWTGVTFSAIGVIAGLGCAVSLAAYWIIGELGQERRDGVSLTFWGFFFASLLWVVVVPPWTIDWQVLAGPSEVFGDTAITAPIWTIAVWNVLMGTIAPFLLVLASLRRLGAQRAGIVGTSEPMFAAIIAAALIGEAVSGVQAIGGLVVIAGILIAESARTPTNDPEGSLPNPV